MLNSISIIILGVCIIILEIDNFRIKKRLREIVDILELQDKTSRIQSKMLSSLYAKKWNDE